MAFEGSAQNGGADCDYSTASLSSELARAQEQVKNNGTVGLNQLRIQPPINKRGGYLEKLVDLADAQFAGFEPGIPVEGTGYGLVYCYQGSTTGGQLDFEFQANGGRVFTVRPGVILRMPGMFDKVFIRLNPNSVTVGTARLIILRAPDVDYNELPPSLVSQQVLGNVTGIGPAGATTQAQAAAAQGVNRPTATTDGQSLSGVSGFRAVVTAPVGQTITAGTVTYWYENPTTGLWAPGPITDTLITGQRTAVGFDQIVYVPFGRVYAELVGGTASGAGAITVNLQTWGN
jgi:hypothetical protein